jgi:hypothetical protein
MFLWCSGANVGRFNASKVEGTDFVAILLNRFWSSFERWAPLRDSLLAADWAKGVMLGKASVMRRIAQKMLRRARNFRQCLKRTAASLRDESLHFQHFLGFPPPSLVYVSC